MKIYKVEEMIEFCWVLDGSSGVHLCCSVKLGLRDSVSFSTWWCDDASGWRHGRRLLVPNCPARRLFGVGRSWVLLYVAKGTWRRVSRVLGEVNVVKWQQQWMLCCQWAWGQCQCCHHVRGPSLCHGASRDGLPLLSATAGFSCCVHRWLRCTSWPIPPHFSFAIENNSVLKSGFRVTSYLSARVTSWEIGGCKSPERYVHS